MTTKTTIERNRESIQSKNGCVVSTHKSESVKTDSVTCRGEGQLHRTGRGRGIERHYQNMRSAGQRDDGLCYAER